MYGLQFQHIETNCYCPFSSLLFRFFFLVSFDSTSILFTLPNIPIRNPKSGISVCLVLFISTLLNLGILSILRLYCLVQGVVLILIRFLCWCSHLRRKVMYNKDNIRCNKNPTTTENKEKQTKAKSQDANKIEHKIEYIRIYLYY